MFGNLLEVCGINCLFLGVHKKNSITLWTIGKNRLQFQGHYATEFQYNYVRTLYYITIIQNTEFQYDYIITGHL